MNRDILVCPLWRRPEFFRVWIDLILKMESVEDLFFIFCLDWGYDKKHMEILVKNFPLDYAIIETPKTSYKLGKQSYNVLNGMIAAAKATSGLIYYVEEDIFPSKDFLKFHTMVHKLEPDIFCSIGTRCNNSPWEINNQPGYYFLSPNPDYQSWGSCFKPDKILEYIEPHFNESYFKDPQSYCQRKFPDSIIGKRWVEQDGLIRRIVEQADLLIAYPHLPRAYHAGFYGYNRAGKGRNLSYEQKVKLIREVAFDPQKMKAHVANQAFYKDSQPVRLDTDFDFLELSPATLKK